MKTILLKGFTCLCLLATLASCTNDETLMPDPAAAAVAVPETEGATAARGDVWSGTLAIMNADGKPEFVVDQQLLIADLENILALEGNNVKLTTLVIEKKLATNDLSDEAYMLVGYDGAGTSIGVMLEYAANDFSLGSGTAPLTVSCRGCASGCNLSFLKVDGHKFPYCNENGCGVYCSKSES